MQNDGEKLTVLDSQDARFYFVVKPWPPPAPSPVFPGNSIYEYVTLDFRNYTFGGDQLICQVKYINGSFDNSTTPCSKMDLPNGRTAEDFDPGDGTDGLVFVIRNMMMVERGEYGILLQYEGAPVSARMEVIVHSQ